MLIHFTRSILCRFRNCRGPKRETESLTFDGFGGCGFTHNAAVIEEHGEAPAEDHSEGEDEEEGAGLRDGQKIVKVAAGEDAYGGQRNDDEEECAVALDHDRVADADEL